MKIIIILVYAIISIQYSLAQDIIKTREISRYTVTDNGLKQNIKDYIQYEQFVNICFLKKDKKRAGLSFPLCSLTVE